MTKHRGRNTRTNKTPSKPLDRWVKFQATGSPDNKVEFRFDDATGLVASAQAVSGTTVTYENYLRKSGKEKVTYLATGLRGSACLSVRHEIASRFDVIAGIDTNTYDFLGRKLSISFAFASAPVLRGNPDEIWLDPVPAFVFEEVSEKINPEVIGWYHFLRSSLPLVTRNGEHSLALVVDSELGMLSDINARNAPYYRTFLLPENVQLVYASSDSGSNLLNQLMKRCDQRSRQLAAQIRDGTLPLPTKLLGGCADYAGATFVNFRDSPYQIVDGTS